MVSENPSFGDPGDLTRSLDESLVDGVGARQIDRHRRPHGKELSRGEEDTSPADVDHEAGEELPRSLEHHLGLERHTEPLAGRDLREDVLGGKAPGYLAGLDTGVGHQEVVETLEVLKPLFFFFGKRSALLHFGVVEDGELTNQVKYGLHAHPPHLVTFWFAKSEFRGTMNPFEQYAAATPPCP